MGSSPLAWSSLSLLLSLRERKGPITLFVDDIIPPMLRGIKPHQVFNDRQQWQSPLFWINDLQSGVRPTPKGTAIFSARGMDLPRELFSKLAQLGFREAIFEERPGEWYSLSLWPYGRKSFFSFTDGFGYGLSAFLQWCELNLRKIVLKHFAVDLHDAGVPYYFPDGHHCYRAHLPSLSPFADRLNLDQDQVYFFEESVRLLPHVAHHDIREHGRGRCSHWINDLFFSSTDLSNPNTNFRRYRYMFVCGKKSIFRPLFRLSSPYTAPLPESLRSKIASASGREATLARVSSRRTIDFERVVENSIEQNVPRGYGRGGAPSDEIILFISSLAPGGAERQMCYLARRLHAHGMPVRVLTWEQTRDEDLHYLEILESSRIPVEFISRPNPEFDLKDFSTDASMEELSLLHAMPSKYGDEVWNVFTHLMVRRPQVIHCWLDSPNIIGGIAGWLAGTPRVILSTRNVNPTHFPYIHQNWYQPWYARLARSPRVGFIANSQVGGSSYAEWMGVPPERFSIVHNGLDLGIMRIPSDVLVNEFRASLNIPHHAPLIAGVFRLNYEKRPSLFLKVIAALKRELPELRAVIAGVGPLQEQIQEEIESRGLTESVLLLGRRSDIPVILRAADLCLLTSSEEGLPNVLMEAQWFGRPAVCTKVGGTSEVVNDGVTGFICEQGNFPKLLEKCRLLLSDAALRHRMGEAGRRWIADNFSLERMYRDTVALYGPGFSDGEITNEEPRGRAVGE